MTVTLNTSDTKPEFKPGDTPYLKFGNEILNNNIPWSEVLDNVLAQPKMTESKVAGRLGTSINSLKHIINGNRCPLTFKQGAILLSMSSLAG